MYFTQKCNFHDLPNNIPQNHRIQIKIKTSSNQPNVIPTEKATHELAKKLRNEVRQNPTSFNLRPE